MKRNIFTNNKTESGLRFALLALFLLVFAFPMEAQETRESIQVTPLSSGSDADAVRFVESNGTLYVVEVFATVGSNSWTAPEGVTEVEYVIIGGGGSGGAGRVAAVTQVGHGGGGAGQALKFVPGESNNTSGSAASVTPLTEYTIIVGSGGAPVEDSRGNNGSTSSAFGLEAIGGGGGGNRDAATADGAAGGSGGGAGYQGIGGASSTGGNVGGDNISSTWAGAGGGGAGGSGQDAQNTQNNTAFGARGGNGITTSIAGFPLELAGGGGGGGGTGTTADGAGEGRFGGGDGGFGGSNGNDAQPHTGSGGGGASGKTTSGAGADGIVIIRYAFEDITADEIVIGAPGVEIEFASDITVPEGTNLTIRGEIIAGAGTVTVESGGTFNDQSTGDAITVIAQRLLTGFEDGAGDPTDAGQGWRYLSSPVATTVGDLLSSIWTQGLDVIGADFQNGPRHIYKWGDVAGNANTDWVAVEDLNDTIEAGQGFIVYVYADDNYDGSPNGNKLLEVSGTQFGSFTRNTNSADNDGWTLLGNPYTTFVSFDELQDGLNLTGTVYAWSPNNTSGDGGESNITSGSWFAWATDGSLGDLTGGLIAPFQAFFVQNEGQSSVPVEFNNDVKSSTLGEFLFNQEQVNYIRMELSNGELSNSAWLRLSDRGDGEKRVSGDAYQLNPMSENYALLAFSKKDDSLFDIAHFPDATSGIEIPVVARATTPGEYTISITEHNLYTSVPLYFADLHTGKYIPLDENFEYTFTIEDNSALKSAPQNPFELLSRSTIRAEKLQTNRFVITSQVQTDVENDELPRKLSLSQNYPNPFNPTTNISFDLPQSEQVRLDVYNIQGQRVATLVNEVRSAGTHNVTFDASRLSSGAYIYRLQAGNSVLNRTMMLVK